jgi:hypothetical protein
LDNRASTELKLSVKTVFQVVEKLERTPLPEDEARNPCMFVSVGARPQADMAAESDKSSSATVVRVAQDTQAQ